MPIASIVTWVAIALILLVAPLVLTWANGRGFAGRADTASFGETSPGWAVILASALAYALAYNLTFFVQELFLVLPKALVQGLNPVLYHNNHTWNGDNPIADLLQASGAIAIFIMGACFVIAVASGWFTSAWSRLLASWLAFHGIIQSTLQVPSGVFAPETDFGDSMNYLGIPVALQVGLAVAAMLLIPAMAAAVAPRLAAVIGSDRLSRGKLLLGLMAQIVLGTLLASPFRWPSGLGNLLMAPMILGVLGFLWLSVFLARASHIEAIKQPTGVAATWLLAGWLSLLLVFQFVLRPGIAF